MAGDDLDLAYLRERPDNLERLITHQRIRETPLPGGDTCVAQRLTLDDGTSIFSKSRADAPHGFFEAEATGLRWLADAGAGALRVPEVIMVGPNRLVLGWVDADPSPGTPAMAGFGRALAATHAAGAERFGAPADGWISSLPLHNRTAHDDWPSFYAEQRVLPYLRLAVDRGAVTGDDARAVEAVVDTIDSVAGEPEPVARLHGDLWAGNVIISRSGDPYVVDPAAHGGHRETDLAMLALFGAPHLETIIDAYDETAPLADGWRERVPLHQLHPLLVHAALFGGGYGRRAGDAARRLA